MSTPKFYGSGIASSFFTYGKTNLGVKLFKVRGKYYAQDVYELQAKAAAHGFAPNCLPPQQFNINGYPEWGFYCERVVCLPIGISEYIKNITKGMDYTNKIYEELWDSLWDYVHAIKDSTEFHKLIDDMCNIGLYSCVADKHAYQIGVRPSEPDKLLWLDFGCD